MRAGELCVRDVVTARSDESVVEVARRMASLDVGDVIVVEERAGRLPHPIGIATDRDLVVHVLAHADRVPATTKLADVMGRELVLATEDDDVHAVLEKMRAHSIRRIPIVDRDGGLQGVLSIDDVLGMLRQDIEIATKLLASQGRGPLHRARR